MSNLHIEHCTTNDNPGDPTSDKWTGSGIVFAGWDGAVVEYCEAARNCGEMPSDRPGPYAIWCFESKHVIIQYCIAHDTLTNGGDGGGIDLDGGTTDSVVQYCLTYGNAGSGYGLYQYGSGNPWARNTLRYCISRNDGTKRAATALNIWTADPGKFSDAKVYNNVFYKSRDNDDGVSPGLVAFANSFSPSPGSVFANNIFVTNNTFFTSGGALTYGNMTILGNCYFRIGGGFSQDGATSLGAWSTRTHQEQVGGALVGINADPLLAAMGAPITLTDPNMLVSMTAFRLLTGSACIDKGITLQGQLAIDPGAFDFFGNGDLPRNGRFDIGAHEYGATPPTPTVTAITPGNGSTAGGTTVTITGTNLRRTASVTFGGNSASAVTVVDDASVTCVAPAHPAGAVEVDVNAAGSTAAVPHGFTYALPTPGTPIISWAQPAAIVYGTVLSATQLSATTGLPGTFGYSPAAGTLLQGGAGQVLHVTFTPTDATAYTTATASVILTVVKKPLTVTALSRTRAFGAANPAFPLAYTGFVGSESSAVLDSRPIAVCAATISSPIGSYPIAVSGGADGNYSFVYVPGSLTITDLPGQTITFASLPSKTYGDAPFALAGTATSGLVVTYASSDPAVATVTGNQLSIVHAGSTTITASQAGDATHAAADPVPQILTVARKSLTITAADKTRMVGEQNPAFTIIANALVGSDTVASIGLTVSTACAATSASPPGTYAITASGATTTANYTVTYAPGTLTVGDPAISPSIRSILPNSGPLAGGTLVTITGTNLSRATSVTFGTFSATSFAIVDATTITCRTPAHAAGAVDVTISSAGNLVISGDGFTFNDGSLHTGGQGVPADTAIHKQGGGGCGAGSGFSVLGIALMAFAGMRRRR